MKQQKLGTKLMVLGLLVVATPIIVVGVISVHQSYRSISDMGKEHLTNIVESLTGALGIGMNQQLDKVKNISFSNSVIAAAEKVVREGEINSQSEIALAERELIKIKNAEGDRISSVNIIGMNGILLASSNIKVYKGLDVSARDYFKTALKGIANVGSVVASGATGRVICTAVCPIYSSSGKDITGVALVGMELKYITDIIDRIKIGNTGHTYIVDKNGLYITHTIKDNILTNNITHIKGMENVADLIVHGKPGIVEYKLDDISMYAAVAFEPITGWGIVASITTAELFAPALFSRNVIVGIGIVSLIISFVLFYSIARSLTLPLITVVEAAERIAAGDLAVQISSGSRRDEIGSLSRAFATMILSLKERAHVAEKIAEGDLTVKVTPLSEADTFGISFSTMVEKLRSQTESIIEGFNILASAGSEILAATTQVASSTAETASAISETSTTVEEVRQATRLSSDKAKNIADNAQHIAQIAQTGRKAAEDAVAGMVDIRNQMDLIAQTIVRLSEQSQLIGGIIASVTDLADQSNLLAVNAAIEAARAGEQGRGFAVVAQEIKSLAEQSKQATTQIRGILTDVQKATGNAVMATEQGSKSVEAGVKRSTQAGEAIRALAETSGGAIQAATQIVSSSQQQVVGMDQIGLAMENINQAGAQTAMSMRQAEAAAQNLHELGQNLKRLVEQYKT